MSLIAMVLILALQDPPKPSAADELEALERDYKKAQQDFNKNRGEDPGPLYLPKFRDLAKHASGETAAGAWGWVFRLAVQRPKNKDFEDAMREAAEALAKDHPTSQALKKILPQLGTRTRAGWVKDYLRALVEKSADHEVKAAAMYALAQLLPSDEALKLFEALGKDYPDTPYGKRADAEIFELKHLQIGMEAPDFEAMDVDGKKFKLSDYRGKVVVIDFWGFW